MNVERLEEIGAERISAGAAGAEMSGAYTSDLLSDAMGNAEEGNVFITVQAHTNSVAVATVAGMPAILVCANRPIPNDMAAAAQREGVWIFRTPMHQYEASVAVWKLLGGGGAE